MVKKSRRFVYMPRRGENIYKRKDGRWEGRYIKEYDSNNKAKYASVYGRTYAETKQKLLIAKNSNQTIEKQHNNHQFNYYALKWLSDLKSQVKASTYVKYTNTINNHILPFWGEKLISEVTTDLLKDFIALKLQKGNINKKTGLSVKTVKDIVSVIKLIIKYAESLAEKSNCNFELLTFKQPISSDNSISKKTQDKLTAFLMNETDYTKLGILFCLYTGVRIGELCAIRFEDICIDEKIIKITKTMQRLQNFSDDCENKTSVFITTPKSSSSQREIPIPDFLMNIILGFDFSPKSYILTGRSDKYVEPRTLEYRFKSCLKKCGLEDYRFHQLRHRFATQCVELGFDVKCLSEIMGHSNVNITLNRYVHASMDLKRVNMDKLQCAIAY